MDRVTDKIVKPKNDDFGSGDFGFCSNYLSINVAISCQIRVCIFIKKHQSGDFWGNLAILAKKCQFGEVRLNLAIFGKKAPICAG